MGNLPFPVMLQHLFFVQSFQLGLNTRDRKYSQIPESAAGKTHLPVDQSQNLVADQARLWVVGEKDVFGPSVAVKHRDRHSSVKFLEFPSKPIICENLEDWSRPQSISSNLTSFINQSLNTTVRQCDQNGQETTALHLRFCESFAEKIPLSYRSLFQFSATRFSIKRRSSATKHENQPINR